MPDVPRETAATAEFRNTESLRVSFFGTCLEKREPAGKDADGARFGRA